MGDVVEGIVLWGFFFNFLCLALAIVSVYILSFQGRFESKLDQLKMKTIYCEEDKGYNNIILYVQ